MTEITKVKQTRYCAQLCQKHTIHRVSLKVDEEQDLLTVQLICTNCGFIGIHSSDYDDVIDSLIV